MLPEPRDCFVEVDGLRLHWLEWGRRGAPVVVLLHGSSAHAHWWDFFAPSLADRFCLVAPDLRGHGDSAHAVPPEYSLERYAADIAGIVGSLGVSSVRVVGHSLGALVAVVFAATSSLSIEWLVLVDSRLRAGSGRHSFLDRLRHWPQPVFASKEDAVRRFRLLPRSNAASPEILAHVAVHAVRPLEDGRLTLKFDRSTLSDAIIRDVSPELARIHCPILYIRGEKSALVPPKAFDELRAVVPSARVAEVSGAHHHVMLDNPAGFEAAVVQFLREF